MSIKHVLKFWLLKIKFGLIGEKCEKPRNQINLCQSG